MPLVPGRLVPLHPILLLIIVKFVPFFPGSFIPPALSPRRQADLPPLPFRRVCLEVFVVGKRLSRRSVVVNDRRLLVVAVSVAIRSTGKFVFRFLGVGDAKNGASRCWVDGMLGGVEQVDEVGVARRPAASQQQQQTTDAWHDHNTAFQLKRYGGMAEYLRSSTCSTTYRMQVES